MNALGEPQRIVLLGGTSEIGIAVVERLATPGCEVVLVGRDEHDLTAVAQRLSARDSVVSIVQLDATALGAHEDTMASCFARDTDVVIVAAGQLPEQQLARPNDAVQSLLVNGVGASSWLLHAYDALRQQGHGCIVVLSSFAVCRPRPSNFVYGAGKAMLDFLTRGLIDNAIPGVTVLLIRPGFVRTRMTRSLKQPPWAINPAAVADAVVANVRGPSGVVWAPQWIRFVARVISVLPLGILRRIDR